MVPPGLQRHKLQRRREGAAVQVHPHCRAAAGPGPTHKQSPALAPVLGLALAQGGVGKWQLG